MEYGADLHTSKHGSGFPMKDKVQSPVEEDYAKSGWNLNNIPNIKGSVLSYIDANISGMKVGTCELVSVRGRGGEGKREREGGREGGYGERNDEILEINHLSGLKDNDDSR